MNRAKFLDKAASNAFDPVALYKGESGKVVALDDRCCHRGAPLSMGRIGGDCIRCMGHGMKFERSGKCIQIPGEEMIPPKLGVRSYPVVEKDQRVWIWMSDPAKAGLSLIVDYPPLREPGWRGLPPAYLRYDANWLLIVDNLSDFTHQAIVHIHTLGGSEEYAYRTKPVAVERLKDGLRVERWHMDSDPPPLHKKVIPNKHDKVNRRNFGNMQVPGILFLDSLFAPAGRGAEKGNLGGVRQCRNSQFMTPETRLTTHFSLVLPARLRPRRPEHRAVAEKQPAPGVHGGQGNHRGAAGAARRRARLQAARHRRRRTAVALPLDAVAAHRRRAAPGAACGGRSMGGRL